MARPKGMGLPSAGYRWDRRFRFYIDPDRGPRVRLTWTVDLDPKDAKLLTCIAYGAGDRIDDTCTDVLQIGIDRLHQQLEIYASRYDYPQSILKAKAAKQQGLTSVTEHRGTVSGREVRYRGQPRAELPDRF